MKKPTSIHFVGIKGVGMTPLAIIAKEAGIEVTGSDLAEQFITDMPLAGAGIVPTVGFLPEHLEDAALVITTGAHGGYDNPEVVAARERHLPVLTKGQAVGEFMNGEILGTKYKGISVAGTHGKTTTAAMLATILMDQHKDPGFLIGTSEIPSLGGKPGHFGSGQYFIAEADEYANEPKYDRTPQFLHQNPQILIITNIEHDHPDIYPTIKDVRDAFLQFADRIPEKGLVILCGDGSEAKEFLKEYQGNVVTYGFSPLNDYVLTEYRVVEGSTEFRVQGKDIDLGTFHLNVGGEHNSVNAVAACLAAQETGISLDEVKTALRLFTGTKRRLERLGNLQSGALVYDDYAHHPTEIKSSLHALRRMYPNLDIICVFQPHTYSRTKELFHEFSDAFGDADKILLLPIFGSSREQEDPTISSTMLAEAIKKKGKDVLFLEKMQDVVEYIDQNDLSETCLFVTMGAGDVYKIADDLKLTNRNEDYRRK